MSSDGKNEIPSNEQVIEELTKDLKNSAVKTDGQRPDEDRTSRHSESDPESDSRLGKEDEIKDEDYIDDKLIEERDEKLSDEEKRVGRCVRPFWVSQIIVINRV